MKLAMRTRCAVSIAAACALIQCAHAQTTPPTDKSTPPGWPAKPVRIIVPFPPGGGADFVARLLAPKLGEQIGGSFVVDNRPGAAGMVGAELAARAAADGYTLLITPPEMAIDPSFRTKLPYDPMKDFAFISQLTSGQYMLVSHPLVPVRTVKQLIALAKSRPGQLNYGHSGAGGINHLAGELLQSMTGMRWENVPFKGTGPAMVGVMSGEVDFLFGSTIGLAESAKSGKVRAIAVTGTKRFSQMPEVPTIDESGVPGYSVTAWYGFYAPAGTSAAIVRRVHAESVRALTTPDARERLAKAGNEPVVSSPQEFDAFLRAEIAKWAKVIKASGLKKTD